MAAALPVIVSAECLKEALVDQSDRLVLLDASWMPQFPALPDTTGKELYESKHIPGALHFDIDAAVKKTKLIPRNLPEPAAFEQYVRSLGINAGSHLVFYDRDDGEMFTAAATRSCFIFKMFGHNSVSVLNGGLKYWEAAGYDSQTGPAPTQKVGDFSVNIHKEMIVEFPEMKQIEKAGKTQIIDTRLPSNFNGEEPEPSLFTQMVLADGNFEPVSEESMKTGHMEDAVNISFMDFYRDDNIGFKSTQDLQKLFAEAGVDLCRPAVVSCYIGHTAAMCSVLASVCGQADFRVYYGSWTEFGQRDV